MIDIDDNAAPIEAPTLSESMAKLTAYARAEVAAAAQEAALELSRELYDPRERYETNGEMWLPIGSPWGGLPTADNASAERPFDEDFLDEIRGVARALAFENDFAIGLLKCLESYVVGKGHVYKVTAKAGQTETTDEADAGATGEQPAKRRRKPKAGPKPPKIGEESPFKQDIENVQAFLDEWLYTRRWGKRQREIIRRKHRDGEVFLRFITNDADGLLDVRCLEPGQVHAPKTPSLAERATFGIETAPRDAETVRAYWVDWFEKPNGESDSEPIAASEIQHRKANVDENTKRGVSSLWPMRKHLADAKIILDRMARTARIQTAYALIRKHENAGRSTVQRQIEGAADYTRENRYDSSKTDFVSDHGPGGLILDAPKGVDYDFPSEGVNVEGFVALVQAELRAAGARLNLPEHMISSDSSNSNYSSTLVAESPAVKMLENEQKEMEDDDLAILWRMLEEAVAGGKLVANLDALEIQVEPPEVQAREYASYSQTVIAEKNDGIRSPQSAAAALGLEYEQELRNKIEAELRENELRKEAGLAPKLDPNAMQPGGPNDPRLIEAQLKASNDPAKGKPQAKA